MSKIFEKIVFGDIDRFKQVVLSNDTLAKISQEFGYSNNGRYTKLIREKCVELGLDINHLKPGAYLKNREVSLTCPQCSKPFLATINTKGEYSKLTCGYSCSNKYFAWKQGCKNNTGSLNNPNNPLHYRNILNTFLDKYNLSKECVVCKEKDVLEIHHIDEDRNNNTITNLVYLCPTHHQALHRYRVDKVYIAIANYLDSIEKYTGEA